MTNEDIKNLEKDGYQADTSKSWEVLLKFLNQEKSTLGHDGIKQSDINAKSAESLWKFVDTNADFSDYSSTGTSYLFQGIYQDVKDSLNDADLENQKYYWNESIWNLYKKLYKAASYKDYEKTPVLENELGEIDLDTLQGGIEVSEKMLDGSYKMGASMRISDVKTADAGANFVKESKVYTSVTEKALRQAVSPWVIPWHNINGHTYSYVRGTDKNIGVLSDDSHLDFSVTKGANKWIRLLLPQNKRRVEIEDLDRNFWVIAQVITTISAYLFDDKGPVKYLLGGMINELAQLWENVMYLWANLGVLGEKPFYEDIHVELVPIPMSDYQSYIKFDNFDRATISTNSDDTSIKNFLQSKLSYLIQTYTESNLVIFPVLRGKNYEKNYYAVEWYPGVLYYNRNKQSDGLYTFERFSSTNTYVDLELYKDSITKYLSTIKESEFYYETAGSIDDVSKTFAEEEGRYYCLLRPDYTFHVEENMDELRIDTFTITYVDLVYKLMAGAGNKNPIEIKVTRNAAGALNYTKTINTTASGWKTTKTLSDSRKKQEIKKGYYQGELVSFYQDNKPYVFEIKALNKIPLLGGTTKKTYAEAAATDFKDINAANTITTLTNYLNYYFNNEIIKDGKTYKQIEEEGEKNILFLEGLRQYSLNNSEDIEKTGNVVFYSDKNSSASELPTVDKMTTLPNNGFVNSKQITQNLYEITKICKSGTYAFSQGAVIRVPINNGIVNAYKDYYNIGEAYNKSLPEQNPYDGEYTSTKQYGIMTSYPSYDTKNKIITGFVGSGAPSEQRLIMRKKGATKWTKDNWLFVVVEKGYSSNCCTIDKNNNLTNLAKLSYARECLELSNYNSSDNKAFPISASRYSEISKTNYEQGWKNAGLSSTDLSSINSFNTYAIYNQCSVSVFGPQLSGSSSPIFAETVFARSPLGSVQFASTNNRVEVEPKEGSPVDEEGKPKEYVSLGNVLIDENLPLVDNEGHLSPKGSFKPASWYVLREVKYDGKDIYQIREGYEVVQVVDDPGCNYERYKDLNYKDPETNITIYSGVKGGTVDTVWSGAQEKNLYYLNAEAVTSQYTDPTIKMYKVAWNTELVKQGTYTTNISSKHQGLGEHPNYIKNKKITSTFQKNGNITYTEVIQ